MRRFFIEKSDFHCQTAVIKGSDAKHIKNVLRLKAGDRIGLFDGTGNEYEAEIIGFSPGAVEITTIRKYPTTTESPVQITVAQAFLKDKKMDSLIRPLTELGITKWFPFMAKRSVPTPDQKRLSARTQRWEKIAKEALKQCERGCIPEIGETISFEELLNRGKNFDLKIIFWEKETRKIDIKLPTHKTQVKKILIVLGPEGGFSAEEIEKARENGFITASLGPRILRSETAAIAACTIVQYLFGDMGKNNA